MIAAPPDATQLAIVGHGLALPNRFEIAEGIHLSPTLFDADPSPEHYHSFRDYAAVVNGQELRNFSIEVAHEAGGAQLATWGWNALWIFHLLSIACRTPCIPLYSHAIDAAPTYSNANRNDFLRPLAKIHSATNDELDWARRHLKAFTALISDSKFNRAMRAYGNSHYLHDADIRVMLLWSGIEGLIGVDAELSRRVALYSAIMLDGSQQEKLDFYKTVRKSYGSRSRIVHGASMDKPSLEVGLEEACQIIVVLLRRCVELGRVPTAAEFDAAAVTQSL